MDGIYFVGFVLAARPPVVSRLLSVALREEQKVLIVFPDIGKDAAADRPSTA
ncbi:hypothetical protein P4E94_16660 [Pontiellaceae bacterium B12219]|nr:hypothetical protein [Pontiellaceae bacterium B12219]